MKFDGLVKLFRGTALCIPQLKRIIFVNNSLILAKGRSARLSRRRALGLSALARKTCRSRARARAFDRREIDIQKWRKCWVFALLFPVPLLRHQESFPIPVESTHWGAAREFDFRDEFAADSPLQQGVGRTIGFRCGKQFLAATVRQQGSWSGIAQGTIFDRLRDGGHKWRIYACDSLAEHSHMPALRRAAKMPLR